jgi:tape measure domain-containing protein
MATSNNSRDVKLTIGVGVTGTEDVQNLAESLGDVSTAGTAAAPGVEKLGAELVALSARTKELRAEESAARAEVQLQKAARDEQKDALARLIATTDKAGKGTDEFKLKERELRLAVIDGGAALREKAKALETASTSAKISAAAEDKLSTQIKETNAAYRQLGAAAAASAAQQAAAHASAGDGLDKLKGQLGDLRNIAVAALGGSYIGSLAKDISATADEYANLQARIKLATGEGAAFEAAFEGVTAVAQRTSSSLETTGNLFTKLADAGRAMGVGQAEALALTETVNQAVQLSGASAQASDAAVTQLIQGLQSGVIRGDEFNSVMEQAPRLARALADGLGATTGELRKMAEAGALSSETVIKALQGQSDAVATEFAKLPPTVGRAIQNLSTSWTLYVGETDKATGASTMAASAINALSVHLKTVAGYLLDAGQAAAAFVALKLAQHFTGLGVAAAQSAVAVAANTAALTAASAAGSGAAVSVGRFAAILGTLKTFTLLGIVTNFHDIGVALGEAAAKLMGYKDRTEELSRAEKTAALIAADTVAMRKRMAEATQDAINKTFELSIVAKAGIAEFDTMTKAGTGAAEAIGKIGKDFDLASTPGIRNAAAVLDKLAADGKLNAAEFQAAWGNALKGDDLAVFETRARAAFLGTAREAERLGQVLDATLRESIKRTGLDFDVISGGMGKASKSAINDTDAMINGLDRLQAMGVDTAQALTASIGKGINTADSQRAIEAVKAQIEAVRKALGDKVADGLLDQAKQKALDLKDALDKATPGITSIREAMKALGVTSDQTFKDAAVKSKAAYDAMKESGTSSARELADGFRKMAADQLAASGEVGSTQRAVTEALLKSEGAVRGLSVAFDANGKMVVKTQGDAAVAIGRTTGAIEAQSAALKHLQDITSAPNGGVVKSVLTKDDMKGVDNTGLLSLQNKRNAGTLGKDDLTTAQAVFDAAAVNMDVYAKNWSAFSLEGQKSITAAYNQSRAILEQVKGLGNATGAGTGAGVTVPSGSTTTVNVNIGGRTTAVKVASQSDANSLTSILRQLESGRGTAS